MYNRYIPQPDGTYRRSAQQDRTSQMGQRQNVSPPNMKQPKPQPEPEKPSVTDGKHHHQNPTQHKRYYAPPEPPKSEPCHERPRTDDNNVVSFLRHLLPKGFDTGDLLIVLLILLMAGDCREDQNSALLTLALYFFL